MLTPGALLPDIRCDASLPDGRIAPVALADYRGKWLVLVFWPLDFVHGVATELRAYSDLVNDFDLSGAVVLGASVDSAYAHQAWTQHATTRNGLGTVQFPLLGDVTRSLARSLGVLAANELALNATFIVTPEGRIASVCASGLSAGRSARDTLRQLHALQSAELAASAWHPVPLRIHAV